jgi:hypothetical protein
VVGLPLVVVSQFGTACLTACKALKACSQSDSRQGLGESGKAMGVAQVTGLEHELPPDDIASTIMWCALWSIEDEMLSSSERGGRYDERAVQDPTRSYVPR